MINWVKKIAINTMFLSLACLVTAVYAAPLEEVLSAAQAQKAPLLETLEQLVAIESGSGDREGLDKLAELIAGRFKALGLTVEVLEPTEIYTMQDTPAKIGKMVLARMKGSGVGKVLLIAHMDTVYLKGMGAQQPFKINGKYAYGLGIADDKSGVAVILHTVAMLKKLNFKDFAEITILINGDEEISSPGSRTMLSKLGSEHDAVFSCEATGIKKDMLSLATSGIGAVALKVKGKASHAGGAPEMGRNALYEMAHQILNMRDLSRPEVGLKMNWTVASAGTNRNVIPAQALAQADVRVLRVADYDGLETQLHERIKNKLIPDTQVEIKFERRRPPLEVSQAARTLTQQAQNFYQEIGKTLHVSEVAEGGGTDAAFASLNTQAPVIERFGLQGFGAHSNDAEYIDIESIVPRLYLLTRMVMHVGQKGAQP